MTQSTYPDFPDLTSMRDIDIQCVDPDTIPDVRDIKINDDESLEERLLNYINQVKNPYCIRCGKILIKIEHSETETTIEDCMEGFFRSLC